MRNGALYDAESFIKVGEDAQPILNCPNAWRLPERFCSLVARCQDRPATCCSGQLLVAQRVLHGEIVPVLVLEGDLPEAKGSVVGQENGLLWVEVSQGC